MSWLRRGLAFFIDVAIIGLIWSLLDNVVSYPVPELLMVLGSAFWFCLYFGMTEGRGTDHASFGKRMTNLLVISPEDRGPTLREILVRALIILLILRVAWGDVFETLIPGAPILVAVLFTSLQLGLIIFNTWLAIWGPERMMLQDTLTNTRVIHATLGTVMKQLTNFKEQQELRGSKKRTWPKPLYFVIIVLMAFGAVFGIHITTSNKSVFDPAEPDVGQIVELAIERELNLRSDVEIETSHAWATAEEASRNVLTIEIWVPYVAWSEATAERILKVAISEVKVTPGYYQSGILKVSSGIRGPAGFGVSRSYQLTMP